MSTPASEQDDKRIARIRQNRFRDPAVLLSSGLGVGWVVPAPGTISSFIAGFFYWIFVSSAAAMVQIVVTAIMCLLAFIALQVLVRKYGYVDARQIVIDEIAGVSVALLLLPKVLWVSGLAFGLFRLFDIWKPFPIGWIDKKMKSGLGILLDDLIAGGMACVIATATWRIVAAN